MLEEQQVHFANTYKHNSRTGVQLATTNGSIKKKQKEWTESVFSGWRSSGADTLGRGFGPPLPVM